MVQPFCFNSFVNLLILTLFMDPAIRKIMKDSKNAPKQNIENVFINVTNSFSMSSVSSRKSG